MKFFIFIFFITIKAYSYPDFISYGYNSCLNCHYNGMGGGALTDYGRSLFATEITARTFVNKKTTDDELGNRAGFFGSYELPYWLRPGFKYRGLFLKSNLGAKDSVDRFIQMEADANVAIALDKKNNAVFVASYGYIPTPRRFATSSSTEKPANWISKEIYFRWQAVKNFWTYFGLMDKAFGLRHPDHTAFNRGYSGFGLGQNDQTHGVLLHYDQKKYDLVSHLFVGNLNQERELRQAGFSLMAEYFITEAVGLGTSILRSQNDFVKWERTALHSKISFAKGKSVLAEIGTRTDTPLQSNTQSAQTGFYTYIQTLINIERGYNFLSTYQTYKDTLTSDGTTRNRLGLGLLMYPWYKTEFRIEVLNDRTVIPANTSGDTWSGLAQVHISW